MPLSSTRGRLRILLTAFLAPFAAELAGLPPDAGAACSPISTPRLFLGNLTFPAGEHKLSLTGSTVIPLVPPLDLLNNGVRVVVEDALAATVVDAQIGPGAWTPETKTGWRVKKNGFTYKTDDSALNQGVYALTASLRPTGARALRFQIRGGGGEYSVALPQLPLKVTIDFNPLDPGTQCAEFQYVDHCRFNRTQKSLVCKRCPSPVGCDPIP